MENQVMFNLNNQIYANNNNLMLEVVNKLENIMNYTNDQIIISRIKDIIIIMNKLINNTEQIRKDIAKLNDNMNEKFKNLENNINNNSNKNNTIISIKHYDNGERYEGEMKNGIREGKGTYYYNNSNRYRGDWKNGMKEGKGIFYYNDGERYEGDFKNDIKEGKGIFYYNNGNRYEGDWKNDIK